jgi:hypothetical protein
MANLLMPIPDQAVQRPASGIGLKLTSRAPFSVEGGRDAVKLLVQEMIHWAIPMCSVECPSGRRATGLFAIRSPTEREVRRQCRVRLGGRLDTVRQRFSASIAPER